MCDHKFIILATAELRSLLAEQDRVWSVRACTMCGSMETRDANSTWVYNIFVTLADYGASDHQLKQRLQMLFDSAGRPLDVRS